MRGAQGHAETRRADVGPIVAGVELPLAVRRQHVAPARLIVGLEGAVEDVRLVRGLGLHLAVLVELRACAGFLPIGVGSVRLPRLAIGVPGGEVLQLRPRLRLRLGRLDRQGGAYQGCSEEEAVQGWAEEAITV